MKKTKLSYNLIAVFSVLLLLLLLGSFISMRYLVKDVQTINRYADEKYTRHYAYISTEDDDTFWEDIYKGASSRGEELGVFVEDFGQNLTVNYSWDELMEIAIQAQVDGLIVEGDPDEKMKNAIALAEEKNIPVVTVFNDCIDSSRVCFVGVSGYAMGRQYGERIIKKIDKDSELIRVSVIMDSEYAESGQNLVVSGISDVFAEAGLDDALDIEVIYVESNSTFGAEEQIRDIILNDELPDVLVGLNAVYTRCLFQAVVDYNKVGEVLLYGFDDTTDVLDAVAKNIVEATIAVKTDDMGASAVEALEEYLNTGYVSDYIAQDTQVISSGDAGKILKANEEQVEINN